MKAKRSKAGRVAAAQHPGGPQRPSAPGAMAQDGSGAATARDGKARRRARKMRPQRPASFLTRLRNNFLTGLVVVAPIGITVYLTWFIVDFVDSTVLPAVLPLVPAEYQPDQILPFSLPGLGVLIFVVFVVFIGGLAKNFFGREILRVGEGWVDRMPVVRSIYNALKQIAETIFAQSGASFDRACLVQYPRRGVWSIAFIATDTKGEVKARAAPNEEMISVFLPTTPNPTSGFLLFVPAKDVHVLDMTVEEAAKLIISAGLITPPMAADQATDGTVDRAVEAAVAAQTSDGRVVGAAPVSMEAMLDRRAHKTVQSPNERKPGERPETDASYPAGAKRPAALHRPRPAAIEAPPAASATPRRITIPATPAKAAPNRPFSARF